MENAGGFVNGILKLSVPKNTEERLDRQQGLTMIILVSYGYGQLAEVAAMLSSAT